MKAVGNNPLARYVGQETGARPHPTSSNQPTKNQLGGTPSPSRPNTPKITPNQDLTSSS